MQYITTSEKETKKLAEELAKNSKSKVFALVGSLGAGKTTFVQGFAKGLKIREKIISPTFVLIRQHKIPKGQKTFYHLDLYRIDNSDDFKSMGLNDLLDNKDNLVLIEWAQKVRNLLPKNTIWIALENIGGDQRKITIT